MSLGRVSLVGAGPGDPELLTLRAAQRLAEADLVLYDALLAPEVRALSPEARWFYVGKRARRESIAQETIHKLMIREAQRGRNVVRLKCGDPFVLGRGGEEALALADAGIPFEVVPGVSTAIAAPALLGIPVTHRGLATGFVVASGHAESAWGPLCDAFPRTGATLVVLMGLGARTAIAARLIAQGHDPETPAAVVLGAGTRDEARWLGTLATLGAAPLPVPGGDQPTPPGVLVIGAVVALASTIHADVALPLQSALARS